MLKTRNLQFDLFLSCPVSSIERLANTHSDAFFFDKNIHSDACSFVMDTHILALLNKGCS